MQPGELKDKLFIINEEDGGLSDEHITSLRRYEYVPKNPPKKNKNADLYAVLIVPQLTLRGEWPFLWLGPWEVNVCFHWQETQNLWKLHS